MIMAKDVTPQPMPTTGMPDRRGPSPPVEMKAGVTTTQGSVAINPGKPPGGK